MITIARAFRFVEMVLARSQEISRQKSGRVGRVLRVPSFVGKAGCHDLAALRLHLFDTSEKGVVHGGVAAKMPFCQSAGFRARHRKQLSPCQAPPLVRAEAERKSKQGCRRLAHERTEAAYRNPAS